MMMARFTIAQFVEGRVQSSHWFIPSPGQKVSLDRDGDNLIVYAEPNRGEVNYTWPRNPHPQDDSRPFTAQHQAELAIRHFERKTGRSALGPGWQAAVDALEAERALIAAELRLHRRQRVCLRVLEAEGRALMAAEAK